MKAFFANGTVQTVLFIVTMVVGYGSFRLFYKISDDFPFSQELILVALGAIATVLITALLLNQQTELELRKEGKILLLDQKATIYSDLIEHLGEVVESGALDGEHLAKLRIINHKLAMLGSADVIGKLKNVISQLDAAVADAKIQQDEQERIMRAVAELTFFMRGDLLGQIEGEDRAQVFKDIVSNNQGLED